MPTDEQRKAIEEVLADRQEAIAAALIEEAETLVPVAVDSTLGELRRRTADKFTPGRSSPASRRSRSPPTGRRSRRAGPISSSALSKTSATVAPPSPLAARSSRGSPTWPRATRRRSSASSARGSATACTHTRSPGNSGATSTARSTTLSPAARTEAQKLRTDGPGCDLPEDRRPLSRVHRRRRRCDATGTPRPGRQDLPDR